MYRHVGLFNNGVFENNIDFISAILFSISNFTSSNYGNYVAHQKLLFLTTVQSIMVYFSLAWIFYLTIKLRESKKLKALLKQTYLQIIDHTLFYYEKLFYISNLYNNFFSERKDIKFDDYPGIIHEPILLDKKNRDSFNLLLDETVVLKPNEFIEIYQDFYDFINYIYSIYITINHDENDLVNELSYLKRISYVIIIDLKNQRIKRLKSNMIVFHNSLLTLIKLLYKYADKTYGVTNNFNK